MPLRQRVKPKSVLTAAEPLRLGKITSNFNCVRVRSFILNGAPVNDLARTPRSLNFGLSAECQPDLFAPRSREHRVEPGSVSSCSAARLCDVAAPILTGAITRSTDQTGTCEEAGVSRTRPIEIGEAGLFVSKYF